MLRTQDARRNRDRPWRRSNTTTAAAGDGSASKVRVGVTAAGVGDAAQLDHLV